MTAAVGRVREAEVGPGPVRLERRAPARRRPVLGSFAATAINDNGQIVANNLLLTPA